MTYLYESVKSINFAKHAISNVFIWHSSNIAQGPSCEKPVKTLELEINGQTIVVLFLGPTMNLTLVVLSILTFIKLVLERLAL